MFFSLPDGWVMLGDMSIAHILSEINGGKYD